MSGSGLVFFSRADLKDNMVSWAAEEGLDDLDLNRSIALCEADLRRRLRILSTEQTVDLTLDAETLRVPARFLSARRLYIPGNNPMEYCSPDHLIRRQVTRDNGQPRKYTLEGVEDELPIFRFAPSPDDTYTLRLTYIADLGLLSDDDCNDILAYRGDLYFYGALVHLAAFLRNDDRLPGVKDLYDELINREITMDVQDKVDGSPLVPRPHTVPA